MIYIVDRAKFKKNSYIKKYRWKSLEKSVIPPCRIITNLKEILGKQKNDYVEGKYFSLEILRIC